MSTVRPGSEPPVGTPGPIVLRMMLGNQLQRLREAAAVTSDQAGYEIRASRSKISRMENGRVGFKERDVADLLTLYGITDEEKRTALLSLARQANTPGWWSTYSDVLADWFETYLGLEAAASVIRTFELQFVHGLFQTEAYARAVTLLGHRATPAEEIDRRVSLRLKRQDLLTVPEPPRVWSVIDEAALLGIRCREQRVIDELLDIVARDAARRRDAIHQLIEQRIGQLVQLAAKLFTRAGARVGFFSAFVLADLHVVGLHADLVERAFVEHRLQPDARDHQLAAFHQADVICAAGEHVGGSVEAVGVDEGLLAGFANVGQCIAQLLCLR